MVFFSRERLHKVIFELKGGPGHCTIGVKNHIDLSDEFESLLNFEGHKAAKHIAKLKRGDKASVAAEEKELIGQVFYVSYVHVNLDGTRKICQYLQHTELV